MFRTVFKDFRTKREITQQEIADELGVSTSLIKQWERGNCTPSPEVLELIAEFFATDINTLLGFSTEKEICFRQEFRELDLEKYKKLNAEDRDFVAGQINALINKLGKR